MTMMKIVQKRQIFEDMSLSTSLSIIIVLMIEYKRWLIPSARKICYFFYDSIDFNGYVVKGTKI